MVMHFVVSVVPASVVVLGVDAIDCVLIRVIRVDEGVLGPIADHHHDPGEEKRDQKDEQGSLPVHEPEADAEQVIAHFPVRETHVKFFSFAGEEILKGVHQSEHQKSSNVFQESGKAVALIAHGGTGIVFVIVLHVVHAHVVHEVGFRGMAKKGANRPDHVMIKPGI